MSEPERMNPERLEVLRSGARIWSPETTVAHEALDAIEAEVVRLQGVLVSIKALCPGFGSRSPMDYVKACREIARMCG